MIFIQKLSLSIITFFMFFSLGCKASPEQTADPIKEKQSQRELKELSVAYFASGCFWCVEAVFEAVRGVEEVVSGYSGGSPEDANYKAVSAGITDHAEAVAVYYDSSAIDYKTLLIVFFDSHDPTTPNRQGPDRGRQYRSAIFYNDLKEKEQAEDYIDHLLLKKVYYKITTEVVALEAFYPAEDYHQDYKKKHPNDSYVKNVSNPRFEAFKNKHPELLKK